MNREQRRKEAKFRPQRRKLRRQSEEEHAWKVGMHRKGWFARMLHFIAMRTAS